MKVAFLGKGNMGTPLATLARNAGHAVQAFDSKGDPLDALGGAQIIFFATRYETTLELVAQPEIAAALVDKVVIDITNPLTSDQMGLTIGFSSSAAEQIAARIPGARVVKAFNTVFATLLERRVSGERVSVPVLIASDHEDAAEMAASFANSIGFETLFAGGLSNARYLEPLAELTIQLGYGLGHGDQIGFGLVKDA